MAQDWFYFTYPLPPLHNKITFPVIIHDIVIVIWEDHIYDQESLVVYKNTIVLDLFN